MWLQLLTTLGNAAFEFSGKIEKLIFVTAHKNYRASLEDA